MFYILYGVNFKNIYINVKKKRYKRNIVNYSDFWVVGRYIYGF